MRPTREANDAVREALFEDLMLLRKHILSLSDPTLDRAWAGMETFCAISLRLMAKTNPSKLRDVMRTVEISALMNGVEILE